MPTRYSHHAAPHGEHQPLPVITGDIGGTNARLSLWVCQRNGQHEEVYAEVRALGNLLDSAYGASRQCHSHRKSRPLWLEREIASELSFMADESREPASTAEVHMLQMLGA
jgi:hypothetical protein